MGELKDKKRPLERTPPKTKKPTINRETSVRPKTKDVKKEQKPTKNIPLSPKIVVKPMEAAKQNSEVETNHTMDGNDYVMGEEITPSPIIGTRRAGDSRNMHDSTCGCNDCFVELCNSNTNITKEVLINIIRNFMKLRKKETTDLNAHEKGCMCVEHLIYYKEKQINIVNKIVEKIQVDN